MLNYYFNKDLSSELAFANLLNCLANDIISGRVRLIETDHQRETVTRFGTHAGTAYLTGRETLLVHFCRSSQEDN